MKIKRFTLLSVTFLTVVICSFVWFQDEKPTYFPEDLAKRQANSANGYLEYMQIIKGNQNTHDVDPALVLASRKQADRLPKGKASLNLNWQFKGPDNVGGRTRALIMDRNNPNHLYAGGVAGGVFESFDGAISWQPYDTDFKVNNISCMTQAIDGSVFVGTGGHFEGASTNSARGYFFVGTGIHKLAGNGTFEQIVAPSTRLSPFVDYATVGEIVADPLNANVLHVAMNEGYRVLTYNQDSLKWLESTPFVPGGSKKCNDIDISNDGQNIIVTFNAAIYVSNDGGTTFTETTPSTSSSLGRIECDIAPSDKNIMYAGIATNQGCLEGIYRSQDGGNTWDPIGAGDGSFDPYANFGVNCQGGWDNMVEVFPDDPGKLVVGGVSLWRWTQSSVDPSPSNGSWERIDLTVEFTASGDLIPNYVHADKHNMVFDPRDSDIAYIASDGGITKSTDFNNGIPTYRVHNYKYGVTQFYGIDVNAKDIVLGGSQDNGSFLVGLEFNNNLGAFEVLGGDGFDAAMSIIDPSIGVAASQFNRLGRIQGIGTTSGNSNLTAADIVSTNAFLGGLCATPEGCSRVFYNCLELWESFNHTGSTDSIEIVEERKTLPPIPVGTMIPFESNNNNIPQVVSLQTAILPFDTISASSGRKLDFDADEMDSQGSEVIINFDTLTINLSTKTLTIRKYNSATENISFSFGTEGMYSNTFLDSIGNGEQVSFVVDSINPSEIVLRVENAEIIFRYRYQVQDQVQAIFASANWPGSGANYNERNVFITRDLLKGKSDIVWHHVAGSRSTPDRITGNVIDMAFSNDGNHLFIGTDAGGLFRVSDLDSVDTDLPHSASGAQIYDIINNQLAGKCEQIGRFSGRAVTSIAVDPNNSDNLIVALGNYGNHTFVARTTIATTAVDPTGTFEFIQGNGSTELPYVPAYSVMIDKDDNNRVLIGNELGVFATDNAFATDPATVAWTEENIGLGRVPVFEIRQMTFDFDVVNARIIDSLNSIENGNLMIDGQNVTDPQVIDSVKLVLKSGYVPVENEGRIYIGTHGRGVYQSDALVGLKDLVSKDSKVNVSSLHVYPNPSSRNIKLEWDGLNSNKPYQLQIYNIKGQLVREFNNEFVSSSNGVVEISIEDLEHGTYIARVVQDSGSLSTKFIKQ